MVEAGDEYVTGEKANRPKTRTAKVKQPAGYSRVAAALGSLYKKEVVIFDQQDNVWYKQETLGVYTPISTPILKPIHLLTGTTKLSETGKQAMRDLLNNTAKSLLTEALPSSPPPPPSIASGGVVSEYGQLLNAIDVIDEFEIEGISSLKGIKNLLAILSGGNIRGASPEKIISKLKEEFAIGTEPIVQSILSDPKYADFLSAAKEQMAKDRVESDIEVYIRKIVTQAYNLAMSKRIVKRSIVEVEKVKVGKHTNRIFTVKELPFSYMNSSGSTRTSMQNDTLIDEYTVDLEAIFDVTGLEIEYIEGFVDLSEMEPAWKTFHKSKTKGKSFSMSLNFEDPKGQNRIYLNVFGEKDTMPLLKLNEPTKENRDKIIKFSNLMNIKLKKDTAEKRQASITNNTRLLIEMLKLGYTPNELVSYFNNIPIERESLLAEDIEKSTVSLMKRGYPTSPKLKTNQTYEHIKDLGLTETPNSHGFFLKVNPKTNRTEIYVKAALINGETFGPDGTGLNEMGISLTDGCVFGTREGYFSIYGHITGTFNEGAIKTWGTIRLSDGRIGYIKNATHEVTKADTLYQLMQQNKVGLLISTTAEKNYDGGSDVSEYSDLVNGTLKQIDVPLSDFHRNKEGGKTKRYTLGFGQYFGRKFLSQNSPAVSDKTLEIADNIAKRRAKRFN